jgi:hypothetical protein
MNGNIGEPCIKQQRLENLAEILCGHSFNVTCCSQSWMNVNLPLLGERSSESLDLPAFDEEKHEEKQEWQRGDHSRRRRTCYTRCFQSLAVIFPWTAAVALSVYIVLTKTWGSNRFQQTKLFPSQMTYSPAQSEIEYVVRTFDHNLVNSPVKFQDPDTVDAAWADLYDGEFYL